MDSEVRSVDQAEPFLVITGMPGEEQSQVFTCDEGSLLLELRSIKDSLIDLIATYYAFDISYPKCLNSVLIFFQHFIFNFKDQQCHLKTDCKLFCFCTFNAVYMLCTNYGFAQSMDSPVLSNNRWFVQQSMY